MCALKYGALRRGRHPIGGAGPIFPIWSRHWVYNVLFRRLWLCLMEWLHALTADGFNIREFAAAKLISHLRISHESFISARFGVFPTRFSHFFAANCTAQSHEHKHIDQCIYRVVRLFILFVAGVWRNLKRTIPAKWKHRWKHRSFNRFVYSFNWTSTLEKSNIPHLTDLKSSIFARQ